MIEPVSTVSFRPFNMEIPRQSSATAPADEMGLTPVQNGARPDARLQEMIQAGRQTSALLSLLPGPNLGFFQAPSPLQLAAGKGAFLAPASGPDAFSPTGGREKFNVPLLETMETGRETSTLLSGLTGPGARAFPAPVPPAFQSRQGAFAPPSATGAAAAAPGTLPRTSAPLLEAEQQGRISSTLFSGLVESSQAPWGASPSLGMDARMANEAYRTESQAQRNLQMEGVSEPARRWEWFA